MIRLFTFSCLFGFVLANSLKADLVIANGLADAQGAVGGAGEIEIPIGQAEVDLNFFAIGCDAIASQSAFTLIVEISDNDGSNTDLGAGTMEAGTVNVPGLVRFAGTTDWLAPPPVAQTGFNPERTLGGVSLTSGGVSVSDTQLGTITIDTRGISPGSYNLTFFASGGASRFGSGEDCGSHSITQTLTAVPEPTGFFAMSLLSTLAIGRSWWTRRRGTLNP